MTELEKQLNTRDGAEDFRDFLEKTSEDGLRVFELWLTLNGYKKEVEKFTRLHDFTDAFAKWNMRCTKALIEKYFKVSNISPTFLPTQMLKHGFSTLKSQGFVSILTSF